MIVFTYMYDIKFHGHFLSLVNIFHGFEDLLTPQKQQFERPVISNYSTVYLSFQMKNVKLLTFTQPASQQTLGKSTSLFLNSEYFYNSFVNEVHFSPETQY